MDIEERIGSLWSKLNFNKIEEEYYEEERKCEELKKRWLRNYADIFKETLTKEDRLDIPHIQIDLIEGHKRIQTFKPKTPMEVSLY